MKKFNKLILPIALLFSLTGCNGAEPTAEGGNVPEGGKEITDKVEEEQALEELVEKSSASLKENDAFSFNVTNKGIVLNASGNRYNFTTGLGEFTLKGGAQGLYSGNKETTKFGANFSGTKIIYKVDAIPNEGEETHIDKNYEVGAINSYFDNGSLYIDASEAGLSTLIKNVVTDTAPAISQVAEQYLGPEGASGIETILTTLSSSELAIDAFIGGTFFSKPLGFNYKMAFKDLVKEENYPLIKINESTTETAKETVTKMKDAFEERTGLAWDDVVTLYTYKSGGKALQFEIDKDKLLSFVRPEDIVYYGIEVETAYIKGSIYFNDKGIPTTASIKEELLGKATGNMFKEAMGSDLSFDSNGEIDVNLTYGSNDFTFPEDYNGYSSFKLPDLSGLLEE